MAKRGKISSRIKDEETSRPIRPRRYKYFFLVVCEDQKTEPAYFNRIFEGFPENTVFLKIVGTGRDPLGVVNEAVAEKERMKTEINKEIDEVWAVFDRDDAHLNPGKRQRFANAFSIASAQDIQIAYSNEVFELWLLLHFKQVDTGKPWGRQEIYQLLADEIITFPGYDQFLYEHGNPSVVDAVLSIGNESAAINRAQKLNQFHGKQAPIEANPCTKVHLLVGRLRHLQEWYGYSS